MAELRSAFRDCLVPGQLRSGGRSRPCDHVVGDERRQPRGSSLDGGNEFAKHVQPALSQLGLAGPGDFEVAQSSGSVTSFRIAPDRLLIHDTDQSAARTRRDSGRRQ